MPPASGLHPVNASLPDTVISERPLAWRQF
jgi:hypothetical protein